MPFENVLMHKPTGDAILVQSPEILTHLATYSESHSKSIIRAAVGRASLFRLAEIDWYLKCRVFSENEIEAFQECIFNLVVTIAREFAPMNDSVVRNCPDYGVSVGHFRSNCFRVSIVRKPFIRC
jgi:hypothetical protein